MKKNIHPTYVDQTVTCSCGYTFVVKSTKDELHIEAWNKCHPAYTGEQSKVTQKGNIDKFNNKYGLNN